jgi:hypothetical protein
MTARGSVIQLRASREEEKLIRRIAKRRNVSVAEAMRQLVREQSERDGVTRGETADNVDRTSRRA